MKYFADVKYFHKFGNIKLVIVMRKFSQLFIFIISLATIVFQPFISFGRGEIAIANNGATSLVGSENIATHKTEANLFSGNNYLNTPSSSNANALISTITTLQPTSTTAPFPITAICQSSDIKIKFTIDAPATSPNIFTAYLSDSTGSFASPVSIGLFVGTDTGTIVATIPGNAIPASGYRIRVQSNNPVVIGTSNPFDLTIYAAVANAPTATGLTSVCQSQAGVVYNVTPISGAQAYIWTIPSGANVTSVPANTNSITVTFGALSGNVTVKGTNVGCVGVVSPPLAVTVNPSVAASIAITATPSGPICTGTSVTFNANPTNGGASPTYQWKKNGLNVGTGATFYTDNALLNGDIITCVLTSNASCVTGSPATSNTITMTVSAGGAPSVTIAASPSSTVCAGTNVTFTATPVNPGTTPVYQWKKNGVNVGTNSPTYSNNGLSNGDLITCDMTSNSSCGGGSPVTSNTITMTVNQNLAAGLSIAANPSGAICAGTNVTFTASPVNPGISPVYQWKKNGVNVGTNSPTYSDNALATGNLISCVMTTTDPCITGSPVTSNTITMTVNPNVTVSVSISASPSGAICAGTNVTFTATPANPGTTPNYQWKKNGVNVGSSSTTFSSNSLVNGDQITCTLTNTANCATGSPATSNTITVTVNTSVTASVSIAANPTGTVCSGDNVIFTATPVNPGTTPVYQWKKNGTNVGTNSPTYSDNSLVNGNTITCVMTTSDPCITGSPATSNTITMTVVSGPLTPGVSISASPGNTICAGDTVTFTAVPTYGGLTPLYQWKKDGVNAGTNSPTYIVSGLTSGNIITCQMTSSSSCAIPSSTTSSGITMTVSPAVGIPGSITGSASVCQGQTGITYSVTSISNATGYVWTLPSGATITAGSNTNSITVTFSAVALSGNITVRGTSGSCNGPISSPLAVVVNPGVGNAGTISGTASVCQGQTGIVYSVPAISNATGYTWSLPSGASITAGSGTNSITVTFSGAATSGNITVQGTSSLCNGQVSAPLAITVGSAVGTAGTITGPASVCQGQTGVVYSVPAITNATGYTWTLPTGASITSGSNTNSITVSFSLSAASGNVTVQGTNGGCTGSVSAPLNINVNLGVGNPGTITGAANVCEGQTGVTYTVPAISNATGYTWTIPAGATITAGTNTASITVDFGTTSGTITVQGTNASCNGQTSTPLAVTVNPPVGNAGTINGPASVCQGETGVIYSVSSITNATGYSWTLPAGATITSGANTDSITVDFSGTASSGNVTVQGTNAGCTGQVSLPLAVTVNLGVGIPGNITGPINVCQGQTGVAYSVPAITNATGYTWTLPTGATIATGINTENITVDFGNTSGTITVQGTNALCNGQTSAPLGVTVNLPIGIPGTIFGTDTVCEGQGGVIYSVASITNATSYIWTVPTGASITSGANTNSITVTFATGATSGNVTVQGANPGCTGAVSSPFAVFVRPSVVNTVSISSNLGDTMCPGSVTFTAIPGNGLTYQWKVNGTNAGSNSATFTTTLLTGTQIVTCDMTSAANCPSPLIAMDTISMTVTPPLPLPQATSYSIDSICSGTHGVSFGVLNPDPSYTYQWTTNPPTTEIYNDTNIFCLIDFPAVGNTTYDIIVSSSLLNCTTVDTLQIAVKPTPAPDSTFIYLFTPVNILICMNNAFNTYQWGYDDAINNYYPDTISGAVYQNLNVGSAFDTTNNFYWVITHAGDCFTKSYYNRPRGQGPKITKDISDDLEVEISPNPVLKDFTTKLNGLYNGKINVSVFDIMGRKIIEKEFWKESIVAYQTFEMENRRAGIYFVRVTYNQTEALVFKIVVGR